MTKMRKFAVTLMFVLICSLIFTVSVYASSSATPNADQVWRNVIEFFLTWIGRLSIVVAIFGAIQWGFARSNGDPEAQSRGLNYFTGGIIVLAITQAPYLFGF